MTGKSLKRGDIYWVHLDPTTGSETKKTRPCLLISNNEANEVSRIIIVAPITSKIARIYPFEVALEISGKKAKVMLNQSRAIDRSRLYKKEGQLDLLHMLEVDEAIKIAFGLS